MKKLFLTFLFLCFAIPALAQLQPDLRIPNGKIIRDKFSGMPVLAYWDSVNGIIWDVTTLHPLPVLMSGTSIVSTSNTGGRTTQTDSIVVAQTTVTVFADDQTVLYGQIINTSSNTIYVGFKTPMYGNDGAAVPAGNYFEWGLRTKVGCPGAIYAISLTGTNTIPRYVIKP